jgi:hypothetical protein
MLRRNGLRLLLVAAVLVVSATANSQSVPAATEGRTSQTLMLGVGFSDYDTDWTYGLFSRTVAKSGPLNGTAVRMEGVSVWLDWKPTELPTRLRGLGIEVEGRDVNFGKPSTLPRLRQDTGLGGLIYSHPIHRTFHPYVKYLAGIGSIDFPDLRFPNYTHDTRTLTAPGGGLEYSLGRGLTVRGDYEYQFWPKFLGTQLTLDPNGYTVGVSYSIR